MNQIELLKQEIEALKTAAAELITNADCKVKSFDGYDFGHQSSRTLALAVGKTLVTITVRVDK